MNDPAPGSTRARFGSGWAGALLIVLTCAAYAPALQNGFVWDDDAYVEHNPTLRSADGLRRIWFDVQATPQYYPAVHTSYWLEFRLWGADPTGYHAVNILLHALAALLFWQVLKFLRTGGAWFAAAWFALHPVHVESVAWITERKNVLGGVLYFASAVAYLRGTETEGRRARWLYIGSLILFLGALLSKTVTGSLPAALLLVLWWKRGRIDRSDVVPLLPFAGLALILGLVTATLEVHHVGASGEEWDLSILQRLQLAGRVPWFYAAKLFWPSRLTFIYPRWDIDAAAGPGLLFPAATAAVVAGLWIGRHRLGRGPLVAVLFFLGTLVPALGFFNVYPMRYSFVADHFQYLASAGPLALAAAGACRFAPWLARRAAGVVPLAHVLILLVLGLLTWRQTQVYRDLETLWRDTLHKNPAAWMAHNNLGRLLQDNGRLDDAVRHYRRALELKPDHLSSRNNLGNVLLAQGQTGEAIEHLRAAVLLDAASAPAHKNLGMAYVEERRLDAAVLHLRTAAEIAPDYAGAHRGLGLALVLQGHLDEAKRHLHAALAIDPADPGAHVMLGEIRRLDGDLDGAVAHYRQALRIHPDDAVGNFDLALTLTAQGRSDEAWELFERAVRLAPGLRTALGGTTGYLTPSIPTPPPSPPK